MIGVRGMYEDLFTSLDENIDNTYNGWEYEETCEDFTIDNYLEDRRKKIKEFGKIF